MSVTLKDIVKRTGLTMSTVSKALHESPEISASTIELVQRVALELGYRCNRQNWRASKAVGVILPEVSSHYYAEVAHSLDEELRRNGYSMVITLSGFSRDDVQEALRKILRQNVCGLIVSAETDPVQGLRVDLEGLTLPTVVISESGSLDAVNDTVFIDCKGCMRLAVDYLKSLGHTKIGYIGDLDSDIRYYAMADILREYNTPIDPAYVRRGEERFEQGGYLRMRELIDSGSLPTAVIAGYDQFAFGAMHAISEARLRIPEDISIMGIDNVVMDAYLPVPMTSVMNPTSEMGVIAVKLLLDNLKRQSKHIVQGVALQCKLVPRSTTAKL